MVEFQDSLTNKWTMKIVWNQIEPNIGVINSHVLILMQIEALLQRHYYFYHHIANTLEGYDD